MTREYSSNTIILLYLGDIVLTQISMQLARLARFWFPLPGAPLLTRPPLLRAEIYVFVVLIWTFTFLLLHLYDAYRLANPKDVVYRIGIGVFTAALFFAGSLYMTFLYEIYVPRLLFVYFLLFDWFLLSFHRILLPFGLQKFSRKNIHPSRILVVGAGRVAQQFRVAVDVSFWRQAEVVGFVVTPGDEIDTTVAEIPVTGTVADIPRLIADLQIDQIVVALSASAYNLLETLIADLQKMPVDVQWVPDVLELAFSPPRPKYWNGLLMVGFRDPALSVSLRLVKRAFDLMITLVLFPLLLPLFVVLAGLIKITSKGPVIFKQIRVGENGRPFTMYKFRTMIVGSEERFREMLREEQPGQYVYKTPHDPRVTSLGKWLRRYSLDELPQLVNVLKGEMSLVGPRPELPFFVDRYDAWQRKRFAVPPGMTGWWQVSGRSDLPMHQFVEYDLYYINNYSLFMDVRILMKTIFTIISAKGAF